MKHSCQIPNRSDFSLDSLFSFDMGRLQTLLDALLLHNAGADDVRHRELAALVVVRLVERCELARKFWRLGLDRTRVGDRFEIILHTLFVVTSPHAFWANQLAVLVVLVHDFEIVLG